MKKVSWVRGFQNKWFHRIFCKRCEYYMASKERTKEATEAEKAVEKLLNEAYRK